MAPTITTTTTEDEKKIEVLKSSIAEYQRIYSSVSNIYDQLRIKTLALIAGEVALLTFIFTDNFAFPGNYYIRVLLFAGIACLIGAAGIFFWIISGLDWLFPYEFMTADKIHKRFATKLAFYEFLNDDYIVAVTHNKTPVILRAKRINRAIYLLAAGVTIVLVVKYGG